MKKLITWILLVVMVFGMFAGCKKNPSDATDPSATAPTEEATATINDVIEYLKAIYKDDGAKTPVDYERFGIVRIAGIPFEVVWTADVAEDLVKAVVNDDGTVTIDVNEKCDKDTPYALTATVTDDNGNTASHSWNYTLPAAVDMVSIVKEAYALKSGESLPYESTLTGKIVAIGTPYNEEYKNITVTIEIEGAEDMPIVCYRLKGEGADKLAMGDTITVTGTLTNYNGTIEFAAGCTLDAVTPGERVEAPEDPKEIVDAAYKLGANESLPYEATLTGKITKIKDPYSSQYNNISVEIVIEGREGKPILCYRMKGAGIDDLDVGDTVTVKGYIINYVGSAGYSTIEFTAGCQMLSYKNTGVEFVMPSTAAEIVKLAYSLAKGDALPEEAALTGVITKVNTPYSSQYGNVTVTMVVGDLTDYPIECFRMKGDGADKIGMGDTITVQGILKNYNGKIEFDTGCKLLAWNDTGKDEPVEEETDENATSFFKTEAVDAPKADTAYKLGLQQLNLSGDPWIYFNGTVVNSYYLGTTKKHAEALDVMLKAVSGGYNLTFIDSEGATKYINLVQSGSYVNAVMGDSAQTVFTYDSTLHALKANVADGVYYIGTYGTHNTLSASNITYITGENADDLNTYSFPARLLTVKEMQVATVEDAITQLKTDYPNGYDKDNKLTSSVKVGDYTFTVTWKVETANKAAVQIKNGKLVTTAQEEAVTYKLIATVTGTDGKSGTAQFEGTVNAKPLVVADGTYLVWVGEENVAMNVLSATTDKSYGYLGSIDTVKQGDKLTGFTAAALYTVKNGANNTFQLIDSDGKVLYMSGTFNSFNLAATAPETGADWTLEKAGTGTYYIRNVSNDKRIALDPAYGSFGAYSDKKSAITLVPMKAADVVITAAMAAQALEAEYADGFENGTPLAESYSYGGTTFTVVWTLDPDNNPAVTIKEGKLVYEPQAEKVTYTLTAKVANGTDEATFTYEGAVPKKVTNHYLPKVVDAPETGVAYKLYINQVAESKSLYFNGQKDPNSQYRLNATEEITQGVEVYLEAVEGVEGGYRLYFMNGETKTYIRVYEYKSGSKYKGSMEWVTEVPAEYFTYNTTYKTLVYAANNSYYLGTYNNNTTFSVSDMYYINAGNVDVSQFPARFVTAAPAAYVPVVVDTPVAGATYKFLIQQNTTGQTLYFNGQKDPNSQYRLNTTEDAAAVDVTLEAVEGVEGGYRLHFMNGETKTYIRVYEYKSGSKYKGSMEWVTEVPAEYFTYNTTYKTLVYTANNSYYLGTYNNNTTFSVSDMYYINAGNVGVSQFPGVFAKMELKELKPVVATAPQTGVAYKLFINQVAESKSLYFNGQKDPNSQYRLNATEDMFQSVEVYLETVEGVEGGYRLYFMDGETKTYIRVYEYKSGSKYKGSMEWVTDVPAEYFTYNTTYKTLVYAANNSYYLGTYNNNTTFSVSDMYYINAGNVDVSQFPARLVTLETE